MSLSNGRVQTFADDDENDADDDRMPQPFASRLMPRVVPYDGGAAMPSSSDDENSSFLAELADVLARHRGLRSRDAIQRYLLGGQGTVDTPSSQSAFLRDVGRAFKSLRAAQAVDDTIDGDLRLDSSATMPFVPSPHVPGAQDSSKRFSRDDQPDGNAGAVPRLLHRASSTGKMPRPLDTGSLSQSDDDVSSALQKAVRPANTAQVSALPRRGSVRFAVDVGAAPVSPRASYPLADVAASDEPAVPSARRPSMAKQAIFMADHVSGVHGGARRGSSAAAGGLGVAGRARRPSSVSATLGRQQVAVLERRRRSSGEDLVSPAASAPDLGGDATAIFVPPSASNDLFTSAAEDFNRLRRTNSAGVDFGGFRAFANTSAVGATSPLRSPTDLHGGAQFDSGGGGGLHDASPRTVFKRTLSMSKETEPRKAPAAGGRPAAADDSGNRQSVPGSRSTSSTSSDKEVDIDGSGALRLGSSASPSSSPAAQDSGVLVPPPGGTAGALQVDTWSSSASKRKKASVAFFGDVEASAAGGGGALSRSSISSASVAADPAGGGTSSRRAARKKISFAGEDQVPPTQSRHQRSHSSFGDDLNITSASTGLGSDENITDGRQDAAARGGGAQSPLVDFHAFPGSSGARGDGAFVGINVTPQTPPSSSRSPHQRSAGLQQSLISASSSAGGGGRHDEDEDLDDGDGDGPSEKRATMGARLQSALQRKGTSTALRRTQNGGNVAASTASASSNSASATVSNGAGTRHDEAAILMSQSVKSFRAQLSATARNDANFTDDMEALAQLGRLRDATDAVLPTLTGIAALAASQRSSFAAGSSSATTAPTHSFAGGRASVFGVSGGFMGGPTSNTIDLGGENVEDAESVDDTPWYEREELLIEFQSRADEVRYFTTKKFETPDQTKTDRFMRIMRPVRNWYANITLLVLFFNLFAISARIGLSSSNFPRWFSAAEMVLDVVMFAANGVNFLIPFEHKGHIITDRGAIARRYLSNPFGALFDFLTTFPMLIFFVPFGRAQFIYARINIAARLLKFHHFFAEFQRQMPPTIHPSVWRLLNYSFDIIIVITVICTVSLVVVRANPMSDNIRWMQLPFRNDVQIVAEIEASREGTDDGLIAFSGARGALVYAWIWLQSLVMIANQDIPYPLTLEQFYFALFSAVITLIALAILLSSVEEIVVDIIERSSVKQHKIGDALAVMEMLDLPTELKEEVVTYYSRMWDVCKSFDFNANADLLADLPDELRSDIEYECNARVIRSIPLFQSVANDPAFVRLLAGELHQVVILPGAPIVVKGEEGDCIFFISAGDAAVLGGDTGDEVLYYLGAGSFFGETTMLFGGERPHTIVAVTLCVCYVVTDTQFEGIVDEYPEALEGILETAVAALQAQQLAADAKAAEAANTATVRMAEADDGGWADFDGLGGDNRSALLPHNPLLRPSLQGGSGSEMLSATRYGSANSGGGNGSGGAGTFGISPSRQSNSPEAEAEAAKSDLRSRFRRKSMAPAGGFGGGTDDADETDTVEMREELRQRFRRKSVAPPGFGVGGVGLGSGRSGGSGSVGADDGTNPTPSSSSGGTPGGGGGSGSRRKSRFVGFGALSPPPQRDADDRTQQSLPHSLPTIPSEVFAADHNRKTSLGASPNSSMVGGGNVSSTQAAQRRKSRFFFSGATTSSPAANTATSSPSSHPPSSSSQATPTSQVVTAGAALSHHEAPSPPRPMPQIEPVGDSPSASSIGIGQSPRPLLNPDASSSLTGGTSSTGGGISPARRGVIQRAMKLGEAEGTIDTAQLEHASLAASASTGSGPAAPGSTRHTLATPRSSSSGSAANSLTPPPRHPADVPGCPQLPPLGSSRAAAAAGQRSHRPNGRGGGGGGRSISLEEGGNNTSLGGGSARSSDNSMERSSRIKKLLTEGSGVSSGGHPSGSLSSDRLPPPLQQGGGSGSGGNVPFSLKDGPLPKRQNPRSSHLPPHKSGSDSATLSSQQRLFSLNDVVNTTQMSARSSAAPLPRDIGDDEAQKMDLSLSREAITALTGAALDDCLSVHSEQCSTSSGSAAEPEEDGGTPPAAQAAVDESVSDPERSDMSQETTQQPQAAS